MAEICGVTEHRCVCDLPPHDTGPHVCSACEGSWEIVDGEFIIRKVPRINIETGEQVVWWDPDPAVALANFQALEALRYMAIPGMDPFIATLLARGPYTAPRGGIRFIPPPSTDVDA